MHPAAAATSHPSRPQPTAMAVHPASDKMWQRRRQCQCSHRTVMPLAGKNAALGPVSTLVAATATTATAATAAATAATTTTVAAAAATITAPAAAAATAVVITAAPVVVAAGARITTIAPRATVVMVVTVVVAVITAVTPIVLAVVIVTVIAVALLVIAIVTVMMVVVVPRRRSATRRIVRSGQEPHPVRRILVNHSGGCRCRVRLRLRCLRLVFPDRRYGSEHGVDIAHIPVLGKVISAETGVVVRCVNLRLRSDDR